VGKFIRICVLILISHSLESLELPTVGTVVLRPEVRVEPLSRPLFTINTDDLINYFENVILFDTQKEFDDLPYIVGFEKDKNIAGNGDTAFAVGLKSDDNISSFTMIRYNRPYIDPKTSKVIGYKCDVIGNADVVKIGSPTTLLITNVTTSIEAGTKLIPRTGLDLPGLIDVRAADKPMSGYVLETANDSVGGGSYTVVAINLGQKDGLAQGGVLDLIDSPRTVVDPYTKKKVDMPLEKFGEIIVYKVGDKISLAIISYSNRAVLPTDQVKASGMMP